MNDIQAQYMLGADPDSGPFPVMPLRRVHLISGASGSGKTTLLFQAIKAMQEGQPFLGYPTQWHPMTYVAFDRREEEQEETMRRVGLDPASIPHYYQKVPLPEPGKVTDNRMEIVIHGILAKSPETRVLIFDAFYLLAAHGRINDYVIMAEWLQRAGDMALEQDLTIIGVVHSAKQRQGNQIIDPRYGVTGSVASGGFTSCQVVMEQPDLKDRDRRRVLVFPRNAKDRSFDMRMDERGILQADAAADDDKSLVLEQCVLGITPKPLVQLAKEMEARTGVGKRTTQRWLDALVNRGVAEKIGHGQYCRAKVKGGGPVADGIPWEEEEL